MILSKVHKIPLPISMNYPNLEKTGNFLRIGSLFQISLRSIHFYPKILGILVLVLGWVYRSQNQTKTPKFLVDKPNPNPKPKIFVRITQPKPKTKNFCVFIYNKIQYSIYFYKYFLLYYTIKNKIKN